MFKTASFFIFLFLLSCTVTKRVHRPGYHLEWKKNYRVQKAAKPETSKKENSLELESSHSKSELDENSNKIKESVADSIQELELRKLKLEEKSETIGRDSVRRKQVEKRTFANKFRLVKSRDYFPIRVPSITQKKKASNAFVLEGFRTVGVVLLCVGGFLLMGSLISYFGFWVLEELFYSLVFSGNGIIAGLLGFLLFLIILIVVFVAFAIVRYILGGSYVGFIVSIICIGAGLLSLLIAASF